MIDLSTSSALRRTPIDLLQDAPPSQRTDVANEVPRLSDGALRILFASYRSDPRSGGQGVYLKNLTRALVELGHSVDVASGPPYPELDKRVGLIKIPSLDLYQSDNALMELRWEHFRSWADLSEWWTHNTGGFGEPYAFGRRFKKWFTEHGRGYDVIHDNQTLAHGLNDLAGARAPMVATLHHPISIDRDLALAAAAGPLSRALIRRWHDFLTMQIEVARQLPHLITVSNASARDFEAEFQVDPGKLTCVHLGIDTDLFRPIPEAQRKPNQLICCASADTPLKGLSFLIEAFSILRTDWPDLELRVIGKLRNGPTKKRLEALGLKAKVEFVSGLSEEEMARAYAEATIAVSPSLHEGFGFPAAEAMACATPVVVSDGGALPEVVADAGRVTPKKNPHALAAAIAELLKSPTRRRELGRAGRQRILTHFNWRRCAEETVAVYRSAIADANR